MERMTDPIVNIPEMEEEVKRCALALLPAEANASWHRDQVPESVNLLGDSVGVASEQEWPARVYLIRYERTRAEVTEAGVLAVGRQRFLVNEVAADWSPAVGDELEYNGNRWRVTAWMRQPVDDVAYYECVGERIL